jgi:hypothetical protein
MPIIKFKTKKDYRKGLEILIDSCGGFYGNNSDEFFVNKNQILTFKNNDVNFEYVENPTEKYPWENVLMGKKKTN